MSQLVLIADDDAKIRELLQLYLTKEGFVVEQAADGAEAILKAQQLKPDLLVLDIMMPVLDGLEVCRQVRKFSQLPIIMLTARVEDDDRIMGLELGADDYVSKPFNPRELVARIKAVLRRSPANGIKKNETLSFPQLVLNREEYSVKAFDMIVPFTVKEMELLWTLASHPGRVFTREQLLESIWGYEYFGDTRTVDTHIKRVRQKIGARDDTPWDIKTVWGVGYKFEVRL